MKTVISEKGQVTIPKRLREQLGLTTGTVLDFISENGKLIAVKKIETDPIEKWRGRGKLPFGSDSMEYLRAIRG